ncbi:MAG: histidine kinase [Candidatus Sulfotelmatobacter sp.]
MWKRDQLGLPSFWPLQVMGWIGFYLLVLLTILPYHKLEEFRNQTICCVILFLASCLLRPVCRSLLQRPMPWLALEMRAFGWSALLGTPATFVAEVVKMRGVRLIWDDFLDDWLQFSLFLFLWCTLYFSIKQWQQATRERERLLRAESEAREARLRALRYQLNPHFLFNSLNAVSTLVLEGNAPAATRMLSQIGGLLRATLEGEIASQVPFSQELALAKQYLAIEQTRLGERLQIAFVIAPESLEATVPSMLLQPLVENAVQHGVGQLPKGGDIAIETRRNDDRLEVVVRNSGPRPTSEAMEHKNGRNGIGLANTVERLKTLYGDNHRFKLQWLEEGGCQVTIELPFQKSAQNVEDLTCVR